MAKKTVVEVVTPKINPAEYQLKGHGKPDGLMVIIDYPTVNEHRVHEICYGTPRRLIDNIIRKLKWTGNIYWTSAVKLGRDERKVPKMEIWKPYVEELHVEIGIVQPKKILCLGTIAIASVLKSEKPTPVNDFHGRGYTIEYGENQSCFMVGTYNPYSVIATDGYFRDVAYDIEKLLTHKTPEEPTRVSMIEPLHEQMLIQCLNKLNTYQFISCDLETTSLNPFDGEIESVGFGTLTGYNVIIPKWLLKHDWCKKYLTSFLTKCKPILVFHNAKFDMKWLELYIETTVTAKIADTMLMHYALDERPIGRFGVHSLKDLARVYFDAADYHFDFKKWNKTPEDERDYKAFFTYQCFDLNYTARLYQIFSQQLENTETRLNLTVNSILFPAVRTFVKAELTGIKLDLPYLENLHQEYQNQINKELYDLWSKIGILHFNPLSPVQVNSWLKDNLGIKPSARRSVNQGVENLGTAKDELKQYAKMTSPENAEIINLIIKIRNLAKLDKTYFKGLLDRVDKDGRIRSEINIAGTATGRLSSSKPNLQNIPSRVEIDGQNLNSIVKNAFIADDGYTLVQMDYAQLELRMASYLSKDEVMAKIFNDGLDMHKIVAGKMFKKEPNQVEKFERFLAKAIGFGILYGRGADALVDGTEMDYYVSLGGERATVQEMQQFIDDFLDQFPTLKEWIEFQHSFVMSNQHVQTIFGRKRRFPLILPDVGKQNELKRQAVNTLIQSAASDLCLASVIKLSSMLDKEIANILLTVHDSILLQVKTECVEYIIPMVKAVMTKGTIRSDFINFDVSVETGNSWGNLKELE